VDDGRGGSDLVKNSFPGAIAHHNQLDTNNYDVKGIIVNTGDSTDPKLCSVGSVHTLL
jgi:hypothetical protein